MKQLQGRVVGQIFAAFCVGSLQLRLEPSQFNGRVEGAFQGAGHCLPRRLPGLAPQQFCPRVAVVLTTNAHQQEVTYGRKIYFWNYDGKSAKVEQKLRPKLKNAPKTNYLERQEN